MKTLSIEHQGRELLHVIGLLTRCLEIRGSTAATRDRWGRDLASARQELETLYAPGSEPDPAAAALPPNLPPHRPRAPAPAPAGNAATGLMVWQQELVLRLERGLGRALNVGDAGCIAWDLDTETMSVATQPLLDELRSNNLTSNVFRRRRDKRPAPVSKRPTRP